MGWGELCCALFYANHQLNRITELSKEKRIMFRESTIGYLRSVIGKEVTQICIGRHQIAISFDSKKIVIIESTNEFYLYNKASITVSSENSMPFGSIISYRVSDIKVLSSREASIIMENGSEINLYDDDPDYEMISISHM